jgi:hypothetical protein
MWNVELNICLNVKHGFYCTRFHKTHIHSVYCCGHLLYLIFSKFGVECRKWFKILFIPLSEAYLSLYQFSLNSELLEQHYVQVSSLYLISTEMWKLQIEIYLCS